MAYITLVLYWELPELTRVITWAISTNHPKLEHMTNNVTLDLVRYVGSNPTDRAAIRRNK